MNIRIYFMSKFQEFFFCTGATKSFEYNFDQCIFKFQVYSHSALSIEKVLDLIQFKSNL